MPKIKREEDDFKIPKFPTYTNQELFKFRDELEKYRVNKILNGRELRYIDFWKYLKDQKAISSDNAVYVNNIYPGTNATLYEVLNDKYEKMCLLTNRVEYAKQQELKALDEVYQKVNL